MEQSKANQSNKVKFRDRNAPKLTQVRTYKTLYEVEPRMGEKLEYRC